MNHRTRGQSFLEGAAILTAATITVKLIGALFKIPLANILGGVGMSYFVTAYDLFTPIYSLVVTGLGIAVSRMVAEQTAMGSSTGVEAVLRAARRIFITAGVLGTLLLLAAAPHFVQLIGNPAALFAVAAIAPAIIFSCLSAIYRGYYQGLSNMAPTAVSQVVESLVRLVAGIALAYGVAQGMLGRYEKTGSLLGYRFDTPQQAELFVLRFAAAAAILGVTLSTMVGALYIRRVYRRQSITRPGPISHQLVKDTGRRLISIAVPIALSTLVVNLSALIDLTSVMNCLHTAISRDSSAILAMYPGGIPPQITLELLPEYLYGSYSGLAYSIFNLIPSLTAAFGVSAIPAVSRAWARKDPVQLQRTVSSILRLTVLVALPAGLGIATLAQPILTFLYPARTAEVLIVAPILRVMGISAVLVAAATPINSILQAIGRERLPLVVLLFGAAIKLVTNYTLISRPEINIQGVPYGTLLCYGVIVVLSGSALRLCAGVRLEIISAVGKPLFCALCSSGTAWLLYSRLPLGNTTKLFVSIVFAAFVYGIMVLLTGTLRKSDINMLPISEKILKRLEMLGFIR